MVVLQVLAQLARPTQAEAEAAVVKPLVQTAAQESSFCATTLRIQNLNPSEQD